MDNAVQPTDAMDVQARREGTEVQEFTSGERADVIIVGGGIGGLAAATALTQKGLSVKVYERAREFGEVGAGMQIASNCTRTLDDLGLLDEAKSLGVVPDRMLMRDAIDARPLLDLDLRRVEERYGHPYMVIHRSDLHGIFLRAAQRQGVELHGGMKAIAYDNVEGGARVTFEDKGQSPLVSGELKVIKNPPFIPAKGAAQRTESESGGSGEAAFAAHSHAVKIAPWLPSPGDYVLCLYIPTDDGDGFVIGGI